jgi:hypothetical protein
MTLRELLEHSNLAALGLLDQEDHAQFERALAEAPEGVRRQVIAEQARWASSGVLLPEATPPAALRDRVLEGVRNAIVESSISADDFSLLRETHGIGPRRVHAGWRAASMGLIAAVVVLGSAFLYVYQTNVARTNSISGNALITELANKFEGEFGDVIFNSSTTRTIFVSDSEEFSGKVAIFASPDWTNSRAVAANLPRLENEEYRIVELDQNDQVTRALGSLAGGVQANPIVLPKVAPGTRLALVRVAVGAREDQGKVLMTATIA